MNLGLLFCQFMSLSKPHCILYCKSTPNPPQVFPFFPAAPNMSELLGWLVWTGVGSPLAVLKKGAHCKGKGSGRCAVCCSGDGACQPSEPNGFAVLDCYLLQRRQRRPLQKACCGHSENGKGTQEGRMGQD